MRTVATASEIERAIADFIERLRKGIRVEAVIMYGSYAAGTADEWSDIDLAIISPDFEGLTLPQRQEIISRLTVHRYPRLSPIGYSSTEYHNPSPHSFLAEIVRTGRMVWQTEG